MIRRTIESWVIHDTVPYYPMLFGFLVFIWGLWLVMPWSVYSTAHVFSVIKPLVAESLLGTVALVIGGCQMIGAAKRNIRAVGTAAVVSFYLWLFVLIAFIAGDWHSLGVPVYFWLTVMNGLGYLNWRLHEKFALEKQY